MAELEIDHKSMACLAIDPWASFAAAAGVAAAFNAAATHPHPKITASTVDIFQPASEVRKANPVGLLGFDSQSLVEGRDGPPCDGVTDWRWMHRVNACPSGAPTQNLLKPPSLPH